MQLSDFMALHYNSQWFWSLPPIYGTFIKVTCLVLFWWFIIFNPFKQPFDPNGFEILIHNQVKTLQLWHIISLYRSRSSQYWCNPILNSWSPHSTGWRGLCEPKHPQSPAAVFEESLGYAAVARFTHLGIAVRRPSCGTCEKPGADWAHTP